MNKLKQNPILSIIIIILIVSVIVTILTQKKTEDNLQVYTTPDTIQTLETSTKKESQEIEKEVYTDPDNNISMYVPKDWTKVTKSGYTTFIHQPSGSSIQIAVNTYDPSINNITGESISESVVSNGYTFTSFQRTSNSSCEILYQDMGAETYDYIEEVYWDMQKEVRLICTFNDKYYEKMNKYYELMLGSFSWERSDPVPEGYALYYNEYGKFTFGYPDSWVTGMSESSYIAMDETSGSSLLVNFTEYTDSLEKFTSVDATNLINTGYSNFRMTSFSNTKNTAIAKCTYISNNVQYNLNVYFKTNGSFLYMEGLSYETGALDDSVFSTCVSLLRDYVPTAAVESETNPQGASGSSTEQNVPEGLSGNNIGLGSETQAQKETGMTDNMGKDILVTPGAQNTAGSSLQQENSSPSEKTDAGRSEIDSIAADVEKQLSGTAIQP